MKEIFAQFKKKDTVICIALALVIIIIAITSFIKNNDVETSAVLPEAQISSDFESKLGCILQKIDGVGKVSTLITYDFSASSDEPAKPVAVIVIAEGASEPEVRIKLQLAVQTALGLKAENIKIFEMGA